MKHIIAIIVFAAIVLYPALADQADVFPVSPHDDVTIEWWYLNAHVTTARGRHLAVICSFFRLGNAAGQIAMDSGAKIGHCHYLIWALTDEDAKTHKSYSLGDWNTLSMLQKYAAYKVFLNPGDAKAMMLLDAVSRGSFPAPTRLLPGVSRVQDGPFDIQFGPGNSLRPAAPQSSAGNPNSFALQLSSPDTSGPHLSLQFDSTRPTMYVGGDGNTGLERPDDMKYLSLTRCQVSGTIDDGHGPEKVASGQGWFDHQWGETWTTQKAGWDWWGVQLKDGQDILFFRQRDLGTGKIFFPLATFMDSTGTLTITKNIVFTPNLQAVWTSPRTQIGYPLKWTIEFPGQYLTLHIVPQVKDQEMDILSSSDAIWEGDCSVTAVRSDGSTTSGVAYMELVGYNSPAVRRTLTRSQSESPRK